MKQFGSRYIITDSKMAVTKFPAMATYYNATEGILPYTKTFRTSSDPNAGTATFLDQPYFETFISRLQNFDGSEDVPSEVNYVVYQDASEGSGLAPVLMQNQVMDDNGAKSSADLYNQNAPSGYHATVLSVQIFNPVDMVPAVHHYRLIYESGYERLTTGSNYLDSVKIFEWVQGAVIKGEGTIELPLVTNHGRNFTYRQESTNGIFIVPYSTTGSSYEVKATGKYTITGTSIQYDVNEKDVLNGNTIN